MEIRVARTLLIAVRPQSVAAREDTLRRAVDLRQLFRTRVQRTESIRGLMQIYIDLIILIRSL